MLEYVVICLGPKSYNKRTISPLYSDTEIHMAVLFSYLLLFLMLMPVIFLKKQSEFPSEDS